MSWNGDRLKFLRKQKGLTQLELAKKLDKAMSTISGYEINNAEPDINTIVKLARILDTTTDYLLGSSNEPWLKVYQYEDLPELIKNAGIEKLCIFKNKNVLELTIDEMEELVKIANKIKERENREKEDRKLSKEI